MHSAPVVEAHVDLDGRRVNYTVQGSGQTIMFVHGWACDASSWRFQVPASSRGYRVITVDLPGHGKKRAACGGILDEPLCNYGRGDTRRSRDGPNRAGGP